jgi:hypothetical protein
VISGRGGLVFRFVGDELHMPMKPPIREGDRLCLSRCDSPGRLIFVAAGGWSWES